MLSNTVIVVFSVIMIVVSSGCERRKVDQRSHLASPGAPETENSTPAAEEPGTQGQDQGSPAPTSSASPTSSTASSPSGGVVAKAIPFPEASKSEIIVKFKSSLGLTGSELKDQIIRDKRKVVHQFRSGDTFVIRGPGRSAKELMKEYQGRRDIAYVEPNYQVKAIGTPNDPQYSDQWSLHNVGGDGGTADADMNFPEAWDKNAGEVAYIGVIDTGFDYNHEDLKDNSWVNPDEIAGNGVDDDNNGYVDDIHGVSTFDGSGDPMDDQGHGTHVAGIAAAVSGNGVGVAGISPKTKVIGCQFLDGSGSGYISDAIKCMEYFESLVQDKGIPVVAINNSWGGGGFSNAMNEAFERLGQLGVISVNAAGNDGSDNDAFPVYPANYESESIITVAAFTRGDQLAYYSNYGKNSVDVAAPGSDVLSTLPNNRYRGMSGTSMAAPHVTGLAALIKSRNPGLSGGEIRNLIFSGGVPVNSYAGGTLTGRRIRISDNGGLGSLSCSNQTIVRRLSPVKDMVVLAEGESLELRAMHLNCKDGGGAVTVRVEPGGERIELTALQGKFQQGVYRGAFRPSEGSVYTLDFGDGDPLKVYVASSYPEAKVVTETYREIAGTKIESLQDDETSRLELPFGIPYAKSEPGFRELFVSANGTISFQNQSIFWSNHTLPSSSYSLFVAPFWDDLAPFNGQGVYWDVLGQEPRREVVIEWRGVPQYNPTCDGAATFQVVLFEDKPDVLFNYKDFGFDPESCNRGLTATVGVQVAGDAGTPYSHNEAKLSSGLSLLWQYSGGSNQDPIADIAVSGDAIVGNAMTLSGANSRDPDGSIASYRWEITSGTGTLGDPTSVSTSFIGDRSGSVEVRLTVTDDRGATNSATKALTLVDANLPPTVNAGPDTLGQKAKALTLSASASDSDGTVVSYLWRQKVGPNVLVNGVNTNGQQLTITTPGEVVLLEFEVTVTDDDGDSASDTVRVVVSPGLGPQAVARAYPETLAAGAKGELIAAASFDPDGSIQSYRWESLESGSAGKVVVTGADRATAEFIAPATAGTLDFRLTVSDDAGAEDSTLVTVNVVLPPVANAGKTVTAIAGTTVTLDASASSSANRSSLTYRWKQLDGPGVTLATPDAAKTEVALPEDMEMTVLTFQVEVTDAGGVSATDVVSLVVFPKRLSSSARAFTLQ